MVEGKKLLTEAEAQQIANKFLLAKYDRAKLQFINNQLVTKDDIQLYHLQGKISLHSRGLLDFMTVGKSASTFDFNIKIDAQQGHVLNYELR